MTVPQKTVISFPSASRLELWIPAIASTLTLTISIGLFVTAIDIMRRGFDFTDEAFYLLWAEAPTAYRAAISFFGYALHPFYVLLGGSIAGLRIAGALVLGALGAMALAASTPLAHQGKATEGGWPPIAALAVAAVLPLVYLIYGLPTPSYNWLPLAGALLLLAAIGRLFQSQISYGSAVLAALAGIVTLLGKPNTAALFAAVYTIAVLLLLPDPRRVLIQLFAAGLVTVGLLFCIALMLPVELMMSQLAAYGQTFGFSPLGRGFLFYLADFSMSDRGLTVYTGLLAFGFAIVGRAVPWLWWMARLAIFLAVIALVLSFWLLATRPSLAVLEHAITAATYALLSFWAVRGGSLRVSLVLGLCCLTPWMAAAGTSNDASMQVVFYGGVPGLVGLYVTLQLTDRRRLLALLIVPLWLCAPVFALARAVLEPYRIATPLYMQIEPTEIQRHGAKLLLDSRTRAFVSAVQQTGTDHGYCRADFIIDLTGEMPGIPYILGGRVLGTPWLLGGNDFSERLARTMIETADEMSRRRAWLVTSVAPRAFSETFIRELGFDLSRDFEQLVELWHPLNDTPIRIHRPRSPPQSAACAATSDPNRK